MNAETIDQSWKNIVLLTQTMEKSASEQNWPDVATQAVDRHKAIQQHFDRFAVGPETASFYHQHLSQFLRKEETLQTLADTAKRESLKNNLTLLNNKKAAKAYQSNSDT